MSQIGYYEVLATMQGDGPTLTAANTPATCILPAAKMTLPANYLYVGRQMRIVAQGRISNAVTTPGTARFDVRMGGTVMFDTGALNLNVVVKNTVPWWLEIEMTIRTIGVTTAATAFGFGRFQSESVVGSAANTAGSNGSLIGPVGTPAVGAGFDSTISNTVDMFFTQTVATGSLTVHNYRLESLN